MNIGKNYRNGNINTYAPLDPGVEDMVISPPHKAQTSDQYHQLARHKCPDILNLKKLQKLLKLQKYWGLHRARHRTQTVSGEGK